MAATILYYTLGNRLPRPKSTFLSHPLQNNDPLRLSFPHAQPSSLKSLPAKRTDLCKTSPNLISTRMAVAVQNNASLEPILSNPATNELISQDQAPVVPSCSHLPYRCCHRHTCLKPNDIQQSSHRAQIRNGFHSHFPNAFHVILSKSPILCPCHWSTYILGNTRLFSTSMFQLSAAVRVYLLCYLGSTVIP